MDSKRGQHSVHKTKGGYMHVFLYQKTTVDFGYPYSWDALFPQQVARANNIDGWIVGRIAD
jgi:hypothetical protein